LSTPFLIFFGGGMKLHFSHRIRRHILLCTLCGREIAPGEEYWACNGSRVCAACLLDFAKQEFAACRQTRGKEIPL
jgi:hypothetical protein